MEYDPDSEVDAVYDDDAVPGIRVEDGCIILTDADDGEYVEVYGINGTCVYRGSDTVIDSLGRGMYIVRRGGRSVKITV